MCWPRKAEEDRSVSEIKALEALEAWASDYSKYLKMSKYLQLLSSKCLFFSVFPIINLWKFKFAYQPNKRVGFNKQGHMCRKRDGAGVGWQGRLLESATSLSGIDLFVFSECVACLITVLHFVFFITHEKHAKILL